MNAAKQRAPPKIVPNLQGTEQGFLDQVLALARATGWLAHHCRPALSRGGRWATPIQGDAGFPDLVLVKGGRVLFWELKMGENTLEVAQEAWRDALYVADAGYQTLTLADWDYIERTLQEG